MTAILSILTAISLLISNGYQIEKTTLYNDPCRGIHTEIYEYYTVYNSAGECVGDDLKLKNLVWVAVGESLMNDPNPEK